MGGAYLYSLNLEPKKQLNLSGGLLETGVLEKKEMEGFPLMVLKRER